MQYPMIAATAARAITVPKNNPGRSGTSQITNRGIQRIPSYQAKLLRIAETIANAARIIARLDADALLSPISAAPTTDSKYIMTSRQNPCGRLSQAEFRPGF